MKKRRRSSLVICEGTISITSEQKAFRPVVNGTNPENQVSRDEFNAHFESLMQRAEKERRISEFPPPGAKNLLVESST